MNKIPHEVDIRLIYTYCSCLLTYFQNFYPLCAIKYECYYTKSIHGGAYVCIRISELNKFVKKLSGFNYCIIKKNVVERTGRHPMYINIFESRCIHFHDKILSDIL